MVAIPSKKIIYQDIDLSFTPHPITGAFPVLYNESAVRQAVKNLVLYNKYEKLFNPQLYSNVYRSLFNNFDPILVQKLQQAIEDVIRNFEPRAQLSRIDIVDNLDTKNGIDITIVFTPINLQKEVTINVFLQRVR